MQISSKGMKNYYDKRINFVEDCVWFHNPVRKQGISLKLQKPWKDPYVIIQKLNDVLYRIQEWPSGKSKVVHYDCLNRYEGENKPTWFHQYSLSYSTALVPNAGSNHVYLIGVFIR